MESSKFSDEQKEYLEGFFRGLDNRLKVANGNGAIATTAPESIKEEEWFGTPVDDLCKEEKVKMEENPFEIWEKIVGHSEMNKFPEGGDVFRFKFNGLFYVSPAQEAFMLRVRTPGNIILSHQMKGLAEIAAEYGKECAFITTRGNFQIREIEPKAIVPIWYKLQDIGVLSKGAGADNVRNITASPTMGFDRQELIDATKYVKELQHRILNKKDLFALPRKFNISYDTGGIVSVVSDTNDIAFLACEVKNAPNVDNGIYFKVQLAGITGHKQFAQDTDIILKPEQTTGFAAAVLTVFSEMGDRTNRKKARLKYLIDRLGIEDFLEEVQKKADFSIINVDKKHIDPRPQPIKHAHIGIHRQKEKGMYYIGVVTPVGKLTAAQMKALSEIARVYGKGEARLTVWQNLLIPHIKESDLEVVKQAIKNTGLDFDATSITAGLVACTGNTGCKFAATNTKGQALIIADYLNQKVKLDTPVNIHLTGCPHSCAQHYIGDIGLLGNMVSTSQGEMVEGYNIVVGGGSDQEQAIGRDLYKSVPFTDVPPLLEKILKFYLEERNAGETFFQFTGRQSIEDMKAKIAC
jgi:ferredoxin-nitrite reductase